jgi:hypothetical protein
MVRPTLDRLTRLGTFSPPDPLGSANLAQFILNSAISAIFHPQRLRSTRLGSLGSVATWFSPTGAAHLDQCTWLGSCGSADFASALSAHRHFGFVLSWPSSILALAQLGAPLCCTVNLIPRHLRHPNISVTALQHHSLGSTSRNQPFECTTHSLLFIYVFYP